jgi:hypothetical protein
MTKSQLRAFVQESSVERIREALVLLPEIL